MINVKGNKKKINKTTNNFVDTTALYNNPQFTDGVAGVNNIKGRVKSKIALPDKFTVEKVSKLKNEQVEYLKNEKPLMVNDKNAIQIEKKLLKTFKVEPSTADKLDHEIYKYENQLSRQKQQAVSLWDDVVNRSQQYIKLFEGVASNSIFQNMASLAARVIAPPPTAEETAVLKERIRQLDPSLITDVYSISKIVQSPELLAYLKNLYEHVKNNVATNKDLEYIINIVKPIVDYIAINSDHFSMNGSPWLMEAYNKIKGSPFNSPMFTPGTASPVPVQTANTNFNFQSDTTAPPTQRHTEAPTGIAQAPAFNPEQVGEIIKTYFELAFSERAQLELFYNNMTNGTNTVPELIDIATFMRGKTLNTVEATLTELIQPLLDALNGLSYVAQSIKNLIINRGRLVIQNGFFFQPRQTLTPTQPQTVAPTAAAPAPASTRAPSHHQLGTATPMEINRDLDHVMNKFNEAFTSNIETMQKLYFDILDKKDSIINKFIVLYDTLFRLDNLYDIPPESAPGKIWIINLFNAFNNLNYPGLNDFKQILRSKADSALVSPNYQVRGAMDITAVESFTPINYIRPYQPEPSTIAQPYTDKPKLLSSSNAPTYTAQPTTGPQIAPTPQPIITGSAPTMTTPETVKIKITKSQATKIINNIIENSKSIEELNKNIEVIPETFGNIARSAEIAGVLIGAVAGVITIRKYFKGRRLRRDRELYYEAIPEDVVETERSKLSMSTLSKNAVSGIIEMAVRAKVSVVSLFDIIVNFVKEITGTKTVEDLQTEIQTVHTELEEIIIEPTAGPSETRARERVQQAMTQQNTAATTEARAARHAQRVMQTRVARTLETQPPVGQEIDVSNAGEELRKLKQMMETQQTKKAIKEEVKNELRNQVNNILTDYAQRMESFSFNSPNGIFNDINQYEIIYKLINDIITNYKSILTDLNVPTDVLFKSKISNLRLGQTYIIQQFMGKDYAIIINKINMLIKLIEPYIETNILIQKLYLILSSARIVTMASQNEK